MASEPNSCVGKYSVGVQIPSGLELECLKTYLVRLQGTDKFCVMKELTVGESDDTTASRIGEYVLNNEYRMLSLLKDESGVYHECGKYEEVKYEEHTDESGKVTKKRINVSKLFVENFHGKFNLSNPAYSKLISIKDLLARKERIVDNQALRIIHRVLEILERLHERNIVHRNITLSNIIMDQRTGHIKLANCYLARQLKSETELITDELRFISYCDPDVVSGKPYLGKPYDIWQVGVCLYYMMYGRLPFRAASKEDLIIKIKFGLFEIDRTIQVNEKIIKLLYALLERNPLKRPPVSQVLKTTMNLIVEENRLTSDENVQVVPVDSGIGENSFT